VKARSSFLLAKTCEEPSVNEERLMSKRSRCTKDVIQFVGIAQRPGRNNALSSKFDLQLFRFHN
jgi:hypothetical protein